ncbi:hypothetical protein KAS41_00670 [Candidatus Parcubacteria bacterium]|nr:hypothetical protein [Candidatus Parcubacteria bacterium]
MNAKKIENAGINLGLGLNLKLKMNQELILTTSNLESILYACLSADFETNEGISLKFLDSENNEVIISSVAVCQNIEISL